MKVKMDLKKILLTPPTTLFERISLFFMLVVTFMIFFAPLRFSPISPLEAALTAALPALSISWGWMLLLRSIFRKEDYCVKSKYAEIKYNRH